MISKTGSAISWRRQRPIIPLSWWILVSGKPFLTRIQFPAWWSPAHMPCLRTICPGSTNYFTLCCRQSATEVPTLGICFGHQALAQCLGGRVAQRNNGAQIGSVQITITPEGSEDALFGSLPPAFIGQVIHWESAVQLPADAVILAHSHSEPHQAFRVGRCIWGVQFHPEITESIVAQYLDLLASRLLAEGHNVDKLRARLIAAPYSTQVLRNFARYVAGQEACKP